MPQKLEKSDVVRERDLILESEDHGFVVDSEDWRLWFCPS